MEKRFRESVMKYINKTKWSKLHNLMGLSRKSTAWDQASIETPNSFHPLNPCRKQKLYPHIHTQTHPHSHPTITQTKRCRKHRKSQKHTYIRLLSHAALHKSTAPQIQTGSWLKLPDSSPYKYTRSLTCVSTWTCADSWHDDSVTQTWDTLRRGGNMTQPRCRVQNIPHTALLLMIFFPPFQIQHFYWNPIVLQKINKKVCPEYVNF